MFHTILNRDIFCLPSQQVYRHAVVRNRTLDTSPHNHEFYEIVLLVSGNVRHILNESNHPLNIGDIVFITPSDIHLFPPNSRVSELLSFQVHAKEMERFFEAYGTRDMLTAADRTPFLHLEPGEVRSLVETYSRIVVLDDADHLRQYRILLGKIMQCYLTHENQGNSPIWLRMAVDQMGILQNAAEGVPAFLRLSNLSHAQLCRLMKKHYGMTPQQYIKNLRLNLAYEMIESTSLDFLTISMEIGYNSFSHFCTSFKEKYDISPSELRRQANLRFFPGASDTTDET